MCGVLGADADGPVDGDWGAKHEKSGVSVRTHRSRVREGPVAWRADQRWPLGSVLPPPCLLPPVPPPVAMPPPLVVGGLVVGGPEFLLADDEDEDEDEDEVEDEDEGLLLVPVAAPAATEGLDEFAWPEVWLTATPPPLVNVTP